LDHTSGLLSVNLSAIFSPYRFDLDAGTLDLLWGKRKSWSVEGAPLVPWFADWSLANERGAGTGRPESPRDLSRKIVKAAPVMAMTATRVNQRLPSRTGAMTLPARSISFCVASLLSRFCSGSFV